MNLTSKEFKDNHGEYQLNDELDLCAISLNVPYKFLSEMQEWWCDHHCANCATCGEDSLEFMFCEVMIKAMATIEGAFKQEYESNSHWSTP